MSNILLLDIARCKEVSKCLKGNKDHPCQTIVDLQASASINNHQVPEPWSGRIDKAPILFISSNPSISDQEIFPKGDWTDERIIDYFSNRFGSGDQEWIINGTKSLRKDGNYGRATMFWAGVKSRVNELLEREPVPGVDYALTELVHCKSKQEQGVPEALDFCVSRYFQKVLASSAAKVIVGLGNLAKEVLRSEFMLHGDKNLYGPLTILGSQRMVALLPHPNARMVRSFEKILSEDELKTLRSFVNLKE